jgi:hypothetical protein
MEKLSLAHHGMAEIEAGKLNLLGMAWGFKLVEHPVIQGPVILELQGAD